MKLKLSKLDAAKNQLEVAILLFFDDRDIVSVHTLTRASHEILEKLCSGKNIKSMHQEIMGSVIKERVQEFRAIVDEPKNFFKHSSRDASKMIEFDSQSSEFFLWDACRLYKSLTGEMPKNLYLFFLWFNLSHPDLFIAPEILGLLAEMAKSFHVKNP